MGALKDKFEELQEEVNKKILFLVNTEGIGSKSNVVYESVLNLEDGKDDELIFNIDGTSTYVVAVSPYALVSKSGYSFSHDAIEFEQLCEIVDAFTPQ